jgi:hypothetical protein
MLHQEQSEADGDSSWNGEALTKRLTSATYCSALKSGAMNLSGWKKWEAPPWYPAPSWDGLRSTDVILTWIRPTPSAASFLRTLIAGMLCAPSHVPRFLQREEATVNNY